MGDMNGLIHRKRSPFPKGKAFCIRNLTDKSDNRGITLALSS